MAENPYDEERKRYYHAILKNLEEELRTATSPLDVARLTQEISDVKRTLRFLSYRV